MGRHFALMKGAWRRGSGTWNDYKAIGRLVCLSCIKLNYGDAGEMGSYSVPQPLSILRPLSTRLAPSLEIHDLEYPFGVRNAWNVSQLVCRSRHAG